MNDPNACRLCKAEMKPDGLGQLVCSGCGVSIDVAPLPAGRSRCTPYPQVITSYFKRKPPAHKLARGGDCDLLQPRPRQGQDDRQEQGGVGVR
jgi:hypothetical protein